MTAALQRLDHGPSIADLAFGPGSPAVRGNDAQLAIREIQVLRADIDLIAPPEAATVAEPLVRLYQGQLDGGDRMRLPQLTANDAYAMRGAVNRVLAVDTSAAPGNREDVVKEERMRRVLSALQHANLTIQQKTTLALARY